MNRPTSPLLAWFPSAEVEVPMKGVVSMGNVYVLAWVSVVLGTIPVVGGHSDGLKRAGPIYWSGKPKERMTLDHQIWQISSPFMA